MHFYGKSIRVKDLYFIEFFKIAVPKLGPDVIFGSYLAQVMFFLCKIHIFHTESEIYFKFYVLIYRPNLKIGPYVSPRGYHLIFRKSVE